MGMGAIPLIGAGLGLVSSFFKNKPQEYRETPFQQQMGNWLMKQMQGGQTSMNPQQLAQWQQAYAVPQQAQWAMNLLPQMFGGSQGFGGLGMPQQGMGMQGMPMQGGWGGQGGGGFGMPPMQGGGMNPFAMPLMR